MDEGDHEGEIEVRLSVSSSMASATGRRAVPLPKEYPHNMLLLPCEGERDPRPAIVGIRTVLTKELANKVLIHQWHMDADPDTPGVRTRLLDESGTITNSTGDLNSIPTIEVSTLFHGFREAHRLVSAMDAPDPLEETTISIWFGFRQGGKPYLHSQASSILNQHRTRAAVIAENNRRRKAARRFFGLFHRPYAMQPVPEIQTEDRWLSAHNLELSSLIKEAFEPCMRALWGAAFVTDRNLAFLHANNVPVQAIRWTPTRGLGDLIRAQSNNPERRTFVFATPTIPKKP